MATIIDCRVVFSQNVITTLQQVFRLIRKVDIFFEVLIPHFR